MRILSWNVQYGKASDGSQDFLRTLQHIRSLGDFDVICLQELARNMSEYCAADQSDHLQMAQSFFKEYVAVWGSGFSWPANQQGDSSRRQEFGNLSLVKCELLDSRVHQLPRPATPDKEQMQRVAVETVIDSKMGPFSIINTHLAFHDKDENQQQIEHLNRLEEERIANHSEPKRVGQGTYQAGFLPSARILCGDFNFTPETSQYRYHIDMNWLDAWGLGHGDIAHLPTCGIFDALQWPHGGHCRDYFWLSHEFQSRELELSLKMRVDTDTSLSDHQPVILELSI